MRNPRFWLAIGLLASATLEAQDSCMPWLIEGCDGDATRYECVKLTTDISSTSGGEAAQVLQEICFQVGSPLLQTLVVDADPGEVDLSVLSEGDAIGEFRFDADLRDFGEDCPVGDRALLVAPIRVTEVEEDRAYLRAVIEQVSTPMIDCLLRYDPTDAEHNSGLMLEGFLKAREGRGFELRLELAMLEAGAFDPGLTYTDIQNTASPAPLYLRPITHEGLFTLPRAGGTLSIITELEGENEALEIVSREFEATFEITSGGTLFVRGDPNSDGKTDLSDAVAILNYLFLGGLEPTCLDSADTDDNGQVQITDAIRVLDYLFSGGPPPAVPAESCGTDPTEDELDCEGYVPCA